MSTHLPCAAAQRLLENLDALANGIERSLTEMSAHSLTGLEESLWIQESLSASISRTVVELRTSQLSRADAERIRAGVLQLRDWTDCYQSVVKAATRMNATMRAAAGNSHPVPSPGPGSSYRVSCFEG